MPNYTVYIANTVSEEFEKEPNKSGLVNLLLEAHYKSTGTSAPLPLPGTFIKPPIVRSASDGDPTYEPME